ncbi:hypothetical protein ACJX0J_041862, partial [Zea mays]
TREIFISDFLVEVAGAGDFNIMRRKWWDDNLLGRIICPDWELKFPNITRVFMIWLVLFGNKKIELIDELDKKAETTCLSPNELNSLAFANDRLASIMREEEWLMASISLKSILQAITRTSLESNTHDIPQVSDAENEILTANFTIEEVKKAVFNMEYNKAPGPDGFLAEFYQVFWEVIKTDLFALKKKLMIKSFLLYSQGPSQRGKSHAQNIKLLLTVFEQIYFAMGEEAVKGNIGWLGGILSTRILIYLFAEQLRENGIFSVQSMYHLLMYNPNNNRNKMIWKLKIPLKIKSTLIILLGLGQLLFTGISALFWWHLIKNQYHQLMYTNKLSILDHVIWFRRSIFDITHIGISLLS